MSALEAVMPERPLSEISRVAMISLHTSPLEQAGMGDAGGLNVYVAGLAAALGKLGVGVDIYTRATSSAQPPVVEMGDSVTVRHVVAGPLGRIRKGELPGHLPAFIESLFRHHPADYDIVHSHYWLSGQVGLRAAACWNIPLVHSMHTMAKVKNLHLAPDDPPEPARRVRGEMRIARHAESLIANTINETQDLVEQYDVPPSRISVIPPGVDTNLFRPGDRAAARRRLCLDQDLPLIVFVGRIQPLKGVDVLLRATAGLRAQKGRAPFRVAIVGGSSGDGVDHVEGLRRMAWKLGVGDITMFRPPAARDLLPDWYRAADLVAVPSYSETFGLVAIEAEAVGAPVVAARVGGLPIAVADGISGILVDGHDPGQWATALGRVLDDSVLRVRLSAGAVAHAQQFDWGYSAGAMLDTYRSLAQGPGLVRVR